MCTAGSVSLVTENVSSMPGNVNTRVYKYRGTLEDTPDRQSLQFAHAVQLIAQFLISTLTDTALYIKVGHRHTLRTVLIA